MVAFLLRRLAVAAVLLTLLSLASFCFFTHAAQGGSGPQLLREWWVWARGMFGGPSWHVISEPTFTRNFISGGVRMDEAAGHTAVLLALTFVFVLVFAVALALVAAANHGSALDGTLRLLSYAAWAVPAFVLGLLVQLLVNGVGGPRGIGPFPLAGWPGSCPAGIGINAGYLTPCPAAGHGLVYAGNVLRYTFLPAVTLALGFVGLHARYLRSALIDTLAQPFIVTARAKGLTERRVLLRHALRLSLPTFAAALLSDMGAILGTALAVDFVFQLNGLGTVFISEFPVEAGTVNPISMTPVLLLTGVLVIVASAIADVAVLTLDPRRRTT